jgi:hypothetical protein
MTYSCRYQALAELLALAAAEPVSDDLPPCDDDAAFATRVEIARDGQDMDTFTRQCRSHDQASHAHDGYVMSVALPGVPLHLDAA